MKFGCSRQVCAAQTDGRTDNVTPWAPIGAKNDNCLLNRKIIGRYNLTSEDVRSQAKFDDTIGVFPEFIGDTTYVLDYKSIFVFSRRLQYSYTAELRAIFRGSLRLPGAAPGEQSAGGGQMRVGGQNKPRGHEVRDILLFSCEGAALEVLMYVRLSVTGQFEI